MSTSLDGSSVFKILAVSIIWLLSVTWLFQKDGKVYLYVFIDLLSAEKSQDLIMNKGGAQLLAKMVTKTDDPQTLRMVAGALANLCGNGEHEILRIMVPITSSIRPF